MLQVENSQMFEDLQILNFADVQPFEVDGLQSNDDIDSAWGGWYFSSSERGVVVL